MIKLALGVVIALTVLTGEGRAGVSFRDGNKLYAACTTTSDYEQGLCLGYVEGAVDYFEGLRSYSHEPQCVPDGTVPQQVQDVVVNYLRDHPENRSSKASEMVVLAVSQAWNCR
jgi:hypothetical protein